MLCSPACTNCQGQSCSNVQLNPIDEDSCDIDEETADSSSVEQFMNIQQEEEIAEVGCGGGGPWWVEVRVSGVGWGVYRF